MSDRNRSTPVLPAGMCVTRRQVLHAGVAGAALLALPAVLRRAHAATTVRLGHTQPLTGPSAPYGIRGRDGALTAVREIKDMGGFEDAKGNKYVFEMTVDDMANDPRQAITLFRQHALNRDIVASLGPTNSVGFLPIIPVAAQLKLPLVGNGSGAPVKQWNDWAYRVNTVAATAVPVLMKALTPKLGIKRLGIVFDQTQDAQAGDAHLARELAGELGYEVVAYEAFRAGDQDFSPQIATLKAGNPDAVYVAAATGDGVKVVSQIRANGLDQPLITGYGSFADPVYWDGTNGGVKGDYTYLGQDLKDATGKLKEWLDTYNKTFEQEATSFSTFGYDSVYTVAEAIKRAGSADREAVHQQLKQLEFVTPIGTSVKFKNPPHGDNLTPTVTVIHVTGRGTYEPIKA